MKGHRRNMQPWKLDRAREFRGRPTRSEAALWNELRGKKLGVRFRRQAPILGWIADFWCPSLRLVVEIDGSSHDQRKTADAYRDSVMGLYGIGVLRIPASLVENHPSDAALIVAKRVMENRA